MDQDRCRRTPDVVFGMRPDPILTPDATHMVALALWRVRVKQRADREFEHRLHFRWRRAQGYAGRQQCKHRRNTVAGACDVVSHAAEDLDLGWIEGNLLLCLAQGSGF